MVEVTRTCGVTTSRDPLTNGIIDFSVGIKRGLIQFSFNVDQFKAELCLFRTGLDAEVNTCG